MHKADTTWAVALRAEIDPKHPSDAALYAWESEKGCGTPALCGSEADLSFAWLSARDPRRIGTDTLSPAWIERLMTDPSGATALSDVFAIFAWNASTRKLFVAGDRLGVQAVYYAQDAEGRWHVSTHLMWLLMLTGHDGTVDPEGFLDQVAFGYAVDPARLAYRGIRKLPPAGYLTIGASGLSVGTYWSFPEPSQRASADDIDELAAGLENGIARSITAPRVFFGLTAGKDSLCLAAAAPPHVRFSSGTFGMAASADVLQAEQIAGHLTWPHVTAPVCSPDDFGRWATHVAFHSGGLATCSYVDMASFVNVAVPPGSGFVMGEGGECVRDFFHKAGAKPLEKLSSDYMTPVELLRPTLAARHSHSLRQYPAAVLGRVRETAPSLADYEFALDFYRTRRMPGNFSLRHSVLSSLRPKLSPFLDAGFIDGAYKLNPEWYQDSRLHRTIVARRNPVLLRFFDQPLQPADSTQSWDMRFAGEIGRKVHDLVLGAAGEADDVFDADGVLALCDTVASPPRGIYHLLRTLSFLLCRSILRNQRREYLASIKEVMLAVTMNSPSIGAATRSLRGSQQ